MQVALIAQTTKNDHITQAFVKGGSTTGFWFEICQVYAPGGRHIRRGVLETGKAKPTSAEALKDAKAAFERETGIRLGRTNPFIAACRFIIGAALAPFRALAHLGKIKFSR